jgi:hypothetical protein
MPDLAVPFGDRYVIDRSFFDHPENTITRPSLPRRILSRPGRPDAARGPAR